MPASPRLQTIIRLTETLHLAALGVWLGAVVMAGATAGIVFGAARELDPTLATYASYDGSHADLAAGFVQNRVFLAADAVQFAAAALTLITLIARILMGLPLRRWSTGLRLAFFGLALGLVSYWLMVLGPQMQTEITAYWAAAAAGENDAAATALAAFEEHHEPARSALGAIALAVTATLGAAGFSATAGPRVEDRPPRPEANAPSLETPRLARGAR